MSNKSKVQGCFKFGCFGCLGVFALMVGLTLLVGAIQLTTDDVEPSPEQREANHNLPKLPELPAFGGQDQGEEIPEILPLPEEATSPEIASGVLILDLSMGEFSIRPGPAGEPIRIKADFDTNSFELQEEFNRRDDGTTQRTAPGRWPHRRAYSRFRRILALVGLRAYVQFPLSTQISLIHQPPYSRQSERSAARPLLPSHLEPSRHAGRPLKKAHVNHT